MISNVLTPHTNEAGAFRGIWPALLTPLTPALDIDHGKFAAHCLSLLARGCGGVTAFGTTGEGPSFSMAERREAVDRLVQGGVPAERLIVSTSCAALPETIALSAHAVRAGAHGVLVLPPFFFKGVSEQGVVDSYRRVIDGTADALGGRDFRLYLYHIPQVSGVALSHGAIAALRKEYPGIIAGLKDSGCDIAHSTGLADAFMKEMTVYVGYEPDLPEMGRRGSTGAISGLANFMPRVVHQLVLAHSDAATPAARERVLRLLDLLKPYSLMPALKGVMAMQSGDAGWLRVRAPLVALTPAEFSSLEQALRAFGLDPQSD